MQSADIAEVVLIHQQAFAGFFLTAMGGAFLRELYAGILSDPSGIAFVYQQGDKLQGFVAGTSSPAGLYTRLLLHRWWRFALASIKPCFSRPSIIPRVLRGLTLPRRAQGMAGHGLLMSIAVLPQQQGKGVGATLVEAFVSQARRRGLTAIKLTTDSLHNDAANHFYCRLGFQISQVITTPENRLLNEYELDLQHVPQSPQPGLRRHPDRLVSDGKTPVRGEAGTPGL
jgi:ribosomal protein S18 acetylase RimI-like enzyme